MRHYFLWIVGLCLMCTCAFGKDKAPYDITDLSVKGRINGENIDFTVAFSLKANKHRQEIALVSGDMVLEEVMKPADGYKLRYDAQGRTYYMHFPRAGTYNVEVAFAARPLVLEDGMWREFVFSIPSSPVRTLEVACDRQDLEIAFPNAMRMTREVREDTLFATSVLGPGHPFTVRWKPQVRELEAKLVLSSEANTVVNAATGALRVNTLFVFDISQGKLTELGFALPESLSVTQVRGSYIRQWRIEKDADGNNTLQVTLNRPQTKEYALEIQSEMVLPDFPSTFNLPVITPTNGIRTSGHLAVGTDSAIHLVVQNAGGLTQVDRAGFPRIILDHSHPRPLPTEKVFCYLFAASPYQLSLLLDDIVPSYDATEQVLINVQEDELSMNVKIDLDVRDAPIRRLVVEADARFAVAGVTGREVEDYNAYPSEENPDIQEVEIQFRKPVLGRTLVELKMELGKGPLDAPQQIHGLSVRHAKNERGYLVLTAEKGVLIHSTTPQNLREVHTGSVPMRVAQAQFAYRFREKGWSLGVLAGKKPSNIRVESFHLASLGEGVLFGSVAVNYHISGAPVDTFLFSLDEALQNVEFVGQDVRRWQKDGNHYIVKLQRKVIGDYNLGIIYTQQYEADSEIILGGAACEGVDTQTGYIVAATHLNLKLAPVGEPSASLLEITRDEVPSNYRLLVNAPVLKSYKYVKAPHSVTLLPNAYDRLSLLPAVIEIMEIESELEVSKKGATESVTRIRYKIKNASNQFLTLKMPDGARVWSTHMVEGATGTNQARTRVTASEDNGMLKIPLKRLRDPNQPITIDLEYGQAHDKSQGALQLTAPRSAVQSTFATWQVNAPTNWAIHSNGGNMTPDARPSKQGSLFNMLTKVLIAWVLILQTKAGVGILCVTALICGVLWIMAIVQHRPGFYFAAFICLLAGWIMMGMFAMDISSYSNAPEDLSVIFFTQAVNFNDVEPLSLKLSIMPSWRQYAGPSSVLAGGIAIICAVLAMLKREKRRIAVSVGAASLLYLAAQLPSLTLPAQHLFTWGAPTLILLYLAGRKLCHRTGERIVVTACLLLCIFPVAHTQLEAREPAARPVLDIVKCSLQAEKDSMEVTLHMEITAETPLEIPVSVPSAILLSQTEISKYVTIRQTGGQYMLKIDRKGEYVVDLKFLSPLPEAGDNQVRVFRMPSPEALSNRVTLTIPEPGLQVESPTAIRLSTQETDEATVTTAMVGPADEIFFLWKPRARQRKLEKTVFYTDVASLVRFDTGFVEGRHRMRFKIAQGELKDILILIPENTAVTAVEGEHLGAWRFDPKTRKVEARLSMPISGEYELVMITQKTSDVLPFTVSVAVPEVENTVRQYGVMGLVTSPSVHLALKDPARAMNVEDFTREAGDMTAHLPEAAKANIRYAFRTYGSQTVLTAEVLEVRPEIRTFENAGFTVADDRLLYNGQLAVEIAKAGVFSIHLMIPQGYDVDALDAAQISHWDENTLNNTRAIQVHFKKKLLGKTNIKLTMSRAVSAIPHEITSPRVTVAGELKHTGQVVISSERGVQLMVAQRRGVSELDPAELGIREKKTMAFRLLRPDWQLVLNTEIVAPRINVDFLHVVKVSEGLVRHSQHFRYQFFNAGVKVLKIRTPENALGVSITGPDIAHLKESNPGSGFWTIELARKWFDRPYPLTIQYETQFDREAGRLSLVSAQAMDTDMQHGYVTVQAVDKMELAPVDVDAVLQPPEARHIPMKFGAEDLSDAAFCYSSHVTTYKLDFQAARHNAADLLEAEVLKTAMTTTVNERGESMTRVEMTLQVGGKRYLETRLPAGAAVWSLLVNKRSSIPSLKKTATGQELILIPLAQASSGEIPVKVDLIYITPKIDAWTTGRHVYEGPQFDLPLKKITWRFYLPEGFVYWNPEGTLAPDEQEQTEFHKYTIATYEEGIAIGNRFDRRNAMKLQSAGNKLAMQGKQYDAKQALESAYQYSFSDDALNEDVRVQLHDLNRQQAVVGLLGRRSHLRKQGKAQVPNQQEQDFGDQFNLQDAERLKNSLDKQDSDNIEVITDRIIAAQEAAAESAIQLVINSPLHGRTMNFNRPLQVNPHTPMKVSFSARPALTRSSGKDALCAMALAAFVFGILALASYKRTA